MRSMMARSFLLLVAGVGRAEEFLIEDAEGTTLIALIRVDSDSDML
jgi:hypothetical protein